MVNVAVYGMSTEAYALASRMVEKGVEVYVIDDATASGFILKPEYARMYPDIASLRDDEPLIPARPISEIVPQCDFLFFAPCIRRSGIEARNTLLSQFRDAVSHIREGHGIVCSVPTGLGGSDELVSLLEHITGLKVGQKISFYYYPLEEMHYPSLVGAMGRRDKTLIGILPDQSRFVDIQIAERVHSADVISRFSTILGIIELFRYVTSEMAWDEMAGNSKYELFLDSMIAGRYDLQILSNSQEDIRSVQYLINNSLKGLDAYIRRLVDIIRITLKEKGMRVSRTNIAIAWSMDPHSMRGDRLEALRTLSVRLRDYAGRVEEYNGKRNLYSDRTNVIVACSRPDYEQVCEAESDIMVIKATPFVKISRI